MGIARWPRFDFVFSVGEDCAAAMLLRDNGLRTCSSPFDWICHSSFSMPFRLMAGRFDGFLQRDRLRWFPKPQTGLRDATTENYEDTATAYYLYHDFPAGVPFDTAYPNVREKYDRRISRLLARLDEGGDILMVWWSRDKRIDDATARDELGRLQAVFPKARLHLLLFENDRTVRRGRTSVTDVADRIVRVVGGICPDLAVTPGYRPATNRILRKLKVSYRKTGGRNVFRLVLARVLSAWHLTKEGRRAARRRWLAAAEGDRRC